MVTLTVFLVRNAETIASPRLHQQLDPPLTEAGYQQAQATWTRLLEEILEQTPREDEEDANDDGVVDPLRNMACFTAPFRSCQATALVMTAASPMAQQDRLTWRYTTVEAATIPTAVPIITVNALAVRETLLECGNVHTVVNAGLLHTAAAEWNNTTDNTAKHKSPLLQAIVQEMKATARPELQKWKQDRSVHPPRRVLEGQYFRLTDEEDVWSLEPMCAKVNLLVDLLSINKYMTPPRKGKLTLKLSQDVEEEEEEPEDIPTLVESTVYQARQVGCDTVFLVVPQAILSGMQQHVGGGSPTDDNVLILLAHETNEEGASFSWEHCEEVPSFPGPVDCLVPPSPDKDPASVPPNQWSLFPPPPPENIPDDYPDLPPFGSALSSPPPPEMEWTDSDEDASSVLTPVEKDGDSDASSVLTPIEGGGEDAKEEDVSSVLTPVDGDSSVSSVLTPEQQPPARPAAAAATGGRGPAAGRGRAGRTGRGGRGTAPARTGRGTVGRGRGRAPSKKNAPARVETAPMKGAV